MKRLILKWLGIEWSMADFARERQRSIKIEKMNSEILSLLKDQVCIASDVHFKSNSVIIVLSKLGNGQVRYVDVDIKNLTNLKVLMDHLQEAFQVPDERLFIDLPVKGFNYRDIFD